MPHIFNTEIKRTFNPYLTPEYTKLLKQHKDKLDKGYWIACCGVCNWLGLSDITVNVNYNEVHKDGISLYVTSGTIKTCPICKKKDIISEVFDCSELH